MIKIRINLIITAVWLAMLALLLIQVYQTVQLYDRKSSDFKSKVASVLNRVSAIHERREEATQLARLNKACCSKEYQALLNREMNDLFELKEFISIRDTMVSINGTLENYLVVYGRTYDSISGVHAHQEILVKDVRQIRRLMGSNNQLDFKNDSIRIAVHNDQRVMHKIVKKAKYINGMMLETFLDNSYLSPSKRIHLPLLDSIISAELTAENLPDNFTFVVSEENSKPIAFTQKNNRYNLDLDTSKASETILFPNKILEDKLLLHVYFPNQKSIVLRSMGSPLIISLVLVILIIITISYMFKTILTQKKLSELKNDLISNMTHEFKTPISTISLACEAMGDPSMMGENANVAAPFVKMISEENKRLGNLVEAILQSAVIDRGELKVRQEEVPLVEVIQSIAKTATFRIAGSDGELDLLLPNEEVYITADRMHVTNMISNLIDNAIKYSNEHIHVTVRLSVEGNKVILSISDKGIGIKKEHISKIFDKLYRIPTGNVHNVKGFGLGLSYVKALVDLFGWSLDVTSQFGEGSEFRVTINR
jgi:two-component system phosphate regulon sensor histidine kinase PhoR